MADKKISALTALTAANVAGGDLLAVVDVSATETKKISASDVAEYVSSTSAITNLLTSKANLDAPTFTGKVTLAPAATVVFEGATDDDFEVSLTVVDPTADRTVTFPNASGTVALTSDLSSYAPLASPALTGTPTAPTAAVGTNSTQVATTAYVLNASDDAQFVLSAAIFTS